MNLTSLNNTYKTQALITKSKTYKAILIFKFYKCPEYLYFINNFLGSKTQCTIAKSNQYLNHSLTIFFFLVTKQLLPIEKK